MSYLSNEFIINVYPFFQYLENKYNIIIKTSFLLSNVDCSIFEYEYKSFIKEYTYFIEEDIELFNKISKYKISTDRDDGNYLFFNTEDSCTIADLFYMDTNKYSKIYNKFKNICIINHREHNDLLHLIENVKKIKYTPNIVSAEKRAIYIYKQLELKIPEVLIDIIIDYVSQNSFGY